MFSHKFILCHWLDKLAPDLGGVLSAYLHSERPVVDCEEIAVFRAVREPMYSTGHVYGGMPLVRAINHTETPPDMALFCLNWDDVWGGKGYTDICLKLGTLIDGKTWEDLSKEAGLDTPVITPPIENISSLTSAVDAVVKLHYNSSPVDTMAILLERDRTDGYVIEKANRYARDLTGLWGWMDASLRERYVGMALRRAAGGGL